MISFIADENIPHKSVSILRSQGYDVLSIGEDFPSLKDTEILALANYEGRVVITFDSDFGDLIFKKGHVCSTGVIYLRLGIFLTNEPADLILDHLSASPGRFWGRFSVIDRVRIRQTEL